MKKKILCIIIILSVSLTAFTFTASANTKNCNACFGQGRIACTRCNGRGVISEYDYGTGSYRDVSCPASNCSGGYYQCAPCKGSGKIADTSSTNSGSGSDSGSTSTGTSSAADFDISFTGVLEKYRGTAKEVVIPAGVTEIGVKAFHRVSGGWYTSPVTTVVISTGVEKIAAEAFANNIFLTTVTFEAGSKLKSIDKQAFSYCNALNRIILPYGTQTIGYDAFGFMKELAIPPTVTIIQGKNFTTGQIIDEHYTKTQEYSDGTHSNFEWHIIKGEDATIYGVKGSAAEKYANEKGITFAEAPANILEQWNSPAGAPSVSTPPSVTPQPMTSSGNAIVSSCGTYSIAFTDFKTYSTSSTTYVYYIINNSENTAVQLVDFKMSLNGVDVTDKWFGTLYFYQAANSSGESSRSIDSIIVKQGDVIGISGSVKRSQTTTNETVSGTYTVGGTHTSLTSNSSGVVVFTTADALAILKAIASGDNSKGTTANALEILRKVTGAA